MKRKRTRHLLTYLLCACLLLSLLSGCGQNNNDNDGRSDIVEDQTPATVETVNAEDFYGCWKYTDLESWVYIYGDGTYEWYEDDGSYDSGTYSMDGEELVMDDVDLRYTLDGEGGLIDSDGDALYPTELPDFTPVAYFEEKGYSFDLEMDGGRVPLEDAVRYYYEDGSYYTTAYGEWALRTISDDIVNDQYREIAFQASCYFPYSSDPELTGSFKYGCTSDLFDYYTGEWLPMSIIIGETSEENIYSYTLNINGEEVRLDYTKTLSAERDVGDCSRIIHLTITVRMPVDYDGLVFCASPSPYTFEEMTANNHEGEGYVVGMALEERTGIDEDYALFCRIR